MAKEKFSMLTEAEKPFAEESNGHQRKVPQRFEKMKKAFLPYVRDHPSRTIPRIHALPGGNGALLVRRVSDIEFKCSPFQLVYSSSSFGTNITLQH